MDLSKLPKLSGGNAPAGPMAGPAPANDPPFAQVSARPIETSPGTMWISLILGVLFVFLGWNFARWMIATAAGQPFSTGVNWTSGPKAGQPVEYWELSGGTAWTDCGMFLFGFAALLDVPISMMLSRARSASAQRLLVYLGAGIMGLATIFNLFACIKLFSLGILPIFSLLAVAVGGYMLLDHYAGLIRRTRA